MQLFFGARGHDIYFATRQVAHLAGNAQQACLLLRVLAIRYALHEAFYKDADRFHVLTDAREVFAHGLFEHFLGERFMPEAGDLRHFLCLLLVVGVE